MAEGQSWTNTGADESDAACAAHGVLAWATAADDDRRRFYRGQSMAGVFRPGDYLTLEPVPIAEIRPGDVVIYAGRDQAGEPEDVVHRVVARAPGGLVTRGDNNPHADHTLVTAENLLGRVTHVTRGGRTWPVRGGRWGLWQARAFRAGRRVLGLTWRLIVPVGRWPYRALRRSGLVARLWRPAIVRLRLETANGPLVKYIRGGRTVAWWWPDQGRFRCRRPYDLIIRRPGQEKPVSCEETGF